MFFKSLRLIKIRPFIRIWALAQKYSLNIMTLVKSVFYYYVIAHWLACYSIGMTILEPDHRLTWLRKLPAPQTVIRETPNVFDDLTFV